MKQNSPIVMPAHVFVEAVRLANTTCDDPKQWPTAIKHIIEWWNGASEPELRCAFGFALYGKFGIDWLSGNPEECWVDEKTWARNAKPRAQATLLNGKLTFVFFKQSIEDEYGFDAKAVDGSEGSSGGKWPGITGDGILIKDSHEALNLVPVRFPEFWANACTEAQNTKHGVT